MAKRIKKRKILTQEVIAKRVGVPIYSVRDVYKTFFKRYIDKNHKSNKKKDPIEELKIIKEE